MNKYLADVNKKETNSYLISLKNIALENNVPIITDEGLSFLIQLIKISGAKRILEIGTAIGYSASAIITHTNCEVTTIERNPKMSEVAKKTFVDLGIEDKVRLIEMDALNVKIENLEEYDIVFIDAAKAQSIKFFNRFKEMLKPGGLIITDNLLFHGLVDINTDSGLSRNVKQMIRKIKDFNQFVVEQDDFDTYIYQIGDGMSVSIKRGD
jgi:predicted O-methyltransferase YrrM